MRNVVFVTDIPCSGPELAQAQDKRARELGRSEAGDLWRVSLNAVNRILLSEEKPVVIQTAGFSDLTALVQEAANAQGRAWLKGTRSAAAAVAVGSLESGPRANLLGWCWMAAPRGPGRRNPRRATATTPASPSLSYRHGSAWIRTAVCPAGRAAGLGAASAT